MTVKVRVEGLDELRAKLRRLTRSEVKGLADGPVKGAAKIIEREAASKAPRDPNRKAGAQVLAESMDTVAVVDSVNAAWMVGPRDFTGLFIEFGWAHAGSQSKVQAQPFLRPAFQAKKGEAGTHAVRGIRKAIERRAPTL